MFIAHSMGKFAVKAIKDRVPAKPTTLCIDCELKVAPNQK